MATAVVCVAGMVTKEPTSGRTVRGWLALGSFRTGAMKRAINDTERSGRRRRG
jgi:hypothetical protein